MSFNLTISESNHSLKVNSPLAHTPHFSLTEREHHQVQRDDASREGEREGDDDDEGPPPARPWIAAHGPAPASAPHAGTRYRLTHRDKLVLMTKFHIFCARLQSPFIIANDC